MITLYKTEQTFSNDLIQNEMPLYRNRDGWYLIFRDRTENRQYLRPLIDEKGERVTYNPVSPDSLIGQGLDDSFVVRDLLYKDLLTRGLPKKDDKKRFDALKDDKKRFDALIEIVDGLQCEVAELKLRIEDVGDINNVQT